MGKSIRRGNVRWRRWMGYTLALGMIFSIVLTSCTPSPTQSPVSSSPTTLNSKVPSLTATVVPTSATSLPLPETNTPEEGKSVQFTILHTNDVVGEIDP